MKVIFFGTPVFAADVLEYLLHHHVNIAAVVTKPDRPKGRSAAPIPSPVKRVAEAQSPPLPVLQPEKVSAPEIASTLARFEADLFVVAAFGEIIKEYLLNMPKIACINLHASLLPKYRGAAPIQHCLINGEKVTGVTIMHMAKQMDAGDIISSAEIVIDPNITEGELEKQLCRIGSELLLQAIRDLEAGTFKRTPQNHAKASYAPKIELQECQINWNEPAQAVHNFIRGVTPYPGAWCIVDVKGEKKRLHICSTRLHSAGGVPGQILSFSKEGLLVACRENAILIRELKLEGKKTMAADAFMRGYPSLRIC